MSVCVECRGAGCKACFTGAVDKANQAHTPQGQKYWLDVEPMGAVRMTRRGKFKSEAAQRYLAYKEHIQWQITKQFMGNDDTIKLGPVAARMIFFMPIPQSWTKKQKAAAPGQYHTSKPDIDNIAKGCMDSVNGILWVDDSQVVDLQVVKVYGEQVGIELEIIQL